MFGLVCDIFPLQSRLRSFCNLLRLLRWHVSRRMRRALYCSRLDRINHLWPRFIRPARSRLQKSGRTRWSEGGNIATDALLMPGKQTFCALQTGESRSARLEEVLCQAQGWRAPRQMRQRYSWSNQPGHRR